MPTTSQYRMVLTAMACRAEPADSKWRLTADDSADCVGSKSSKITSVQQTESVEERDRCTKSRSAPREVHSRNSPGEHKSVQSILED